MIDADNINHIFLDKIKTYYTKHESSNKFNKNIVANKVCISLKASANKEQSDFNLSQYKTTLFNRLKRHDITQLHFYFEDGTKEMFLVDWSGCDFVNKYQHEEIDKDGTFTIIVNKKYSKHSADKTLARIENIIFDAIDAPSNNISWEDTVKSIHEEIKNLERNS